MWQDFPSGQAHFEGPLLMKQLRLLPPPNCSAIRRRKKKEGRGQIVLLGNYFVRPQAPMSSIIIAPLLCYHFFLVALKHCIPFARLSPPKKRNAWTLTIPLGAYKSPLLFIYPTEEAEEEAEEVICPRNDKKCEAFMTNGLAFIAFFSHTLTKQSTGQKKGGPPEKDNEEFHIVK